MIEQAVARIPGRWLTIAGAALAMLVTMLFFVALQLRAHRRVVAQRAIVEEQRASLLAEIKGWIEAEKSGATGVTNG